MRDRTACQVGLALSLGGLLLACLPSFPADRGSGDAAAAGSDSGAADVVTQVLTQDSATESATPDGTTADAGAVDGASEASKADAASAADTAIPPDARDASSDSAVSDATVDHEASAPGCSGATPTSCGSTCTNTQTDALNCGGCGLACPGQALGETCAASKCQAYSIASATAPFALAADGVNIYYLETSGTAGVELASVPVGGGSGGGPIAVPGAASVTTDGTDVYWGGTEAQFSTGFISLAPVSNLSAVSPVLTNFTDPEVLVFADPTINTLFFATLCDGIFPVPLQTANATNGGGGGTDGCAHSLTADASQWYWANPSSDPSNSLFGVFASSPFKTLSTATNVQGLALEGAFVYYTDAAGGTVSRVPTNGSVPASAIAVASSPRGLVADIGNVYWIDASGATIMKVALAGGTATAVATGQSATAIAQDGSSVYWANSAAIMRLPK